MNPHDLSGYRERLEGSGLNCKEALWFYGFLIGLLFFLLVVLP